MLIVKFLENKNLLILTHNLELVNLLKFQVKDCFNLYLYNNKEFGENGFIKITKKEEEILINMRKLIELLRNNIFEHIEDEKNFMISMIPFMRGYANIIDFSQETENIYQRLSKVMHGYEEEKIDIACIYNELFGTSITEDYTICVEDILSTEIEKNKLLKSTSEYSVLNNTFYHTVNYLKIRLMVEKGLVDFYNLDMSRFRNPSVGDIIREAFKIKEEDTEETRKQKNIDRVFFTSRKTLLNDFNHFEGNMNIFQPAIDITNKVLEEEKKKIIAKLEEIRVREK